MIIFDEADQLLDMGFRASITQALSYLPPPGHRQSFLFSATFPNEVASLTKDALGPGYQIVDTVGEDEQTNKHVPQSCQVCAHEAIPAHLYAAIDAEARSDPDYKIIVFFPTARMTQVSQRKSIRERERERGCTHSRMNAHAHTHAHTHTHGHSDAFFLSFFFLSQFYSELFNGLGMRVLEMHSRKSQTQRNKMADQFRTQTGLCMFTSDVSARGMDYPDVSLVVQCGMPSDAAQYVHRLGRTGRAGKQVSGIREKRGRSSERKEWRQALDPPNTHTHTHTARSNTPHTNRESGRVQRDAPQMPLPRLPFLIPW